MLPEEEHRTSDRGRFYDRLLLLQHTAAEQPDDTKQSTTQQSSRTRLRSCRGERLVDIACLCYAEASTYLDIFLDKQIVIYMIQSNGVSLSTPAKYAAANVSKTDLFTIAVSSFGYGRNS